MIMQNNHNIKNILMVETDKSVKYRIKLRALYVFMAQVTIKRGNINLTTLIFSSLSDIEGRIAPRISA